MTNFNRDQISKLRNAIDTITENAEFDRQIVSTGIFEAWNLLNEDSTLMKIVGTDPQGRNLVKYLHRLHKVSDVANFELHPLKIRNEKGLSVGNRVMLKPEKSYADNILLMRCEKGWAFLKVRAEETRTDKTTGIKKGDPENVFQNYEFYVAVGNQVLDDKQVDAAIGEIEKNRSSMGSDIRQTPDYYRRNTPRGGRHFAHEPENNAFDRIREIIGDVTGLWNATEREKYMDTPLGQYNLMARKNLGLDDSRILTPDEQNALAQEVSRLRSKFDLGQGRGRPGAGRPRGASIEASKLANRAEMKQGKEPQQIIASRLARLIPTLLTQIRISKRRANPSDPNIEKIGNYIKTPEKVRPQFDSIIKDILAPMDPQKVQDAANGDPAVLQEILKRLRIQLSGINWNYW